MLSKIDLEQSLSKQEYKASKSKLCRRLTVLQQELRQSKTPVAVVFEGWDAAGKGRLINELILPLDPRGFNVYSTLAPDEDARYRPFLWRFWIHTPAEGRFAIFDRSWYRRILNDRVDGHVKGKKLDKACRDISAFERQLADSGCVIIKFFLHISKSEQKARFKKLLADRATAWRVGEDDKKRHKQYDLYLKATDEMLSKTNSAFAPWTVIPAHDRRLAAIRIFETILKALEKPVVKKRTPRALMGGGKVVSALDSVDLSLSLERDEYTERLKKGQKKLRELEHAIYKKRVPAIILYEGWDAAGKGGNIKRLTRELDPRGYEVVPVSAPTTVEKAHHYLWRFWTQIPKAGHITIFDRTWYGRVMVERVEGFCSEADWRRAYMEINETERHLTDFGAVIVKFWLHIDEKEQLRRFKEREKIVYKQWKITDEDWRNREKWDLYKTAVDEMIFRTSTPAAPWTIVESNCKLFARVKTIETVIAALKSRV